MKLLVNIYCIYYETNIYSKVWYLVTDDMMCVWKRSNCQRKFLIKN